MIALELADLVVIASRTLGLDTDEVVDLLDPVAAQHALALVRPGDAPGDPAGLAAALLRGLVRERPLRRGNQQVALAAMLQFLALNGWDVDPDPPGPVASVIAELADGALDVRQVADWLAPRLRLTDRAEASAKEGPMRRASGRLLAERLKRVTTRTQPTGRFRRYTDRARRAVELAGEEARLLRHNYIGTEHLLLGLLYEGEGVAARALESLGISREDVRGQVEEIIGHGMSSPVSHLTFTPRARKVLELSLREALALGHHYIGTEHLLLGLLREGDGVAAQVLVRVGADLCTVRERVLGLLAGGREQADPQTRLVRLAVPAELADAAKELARVRRQKEAAFGEGDLDRAAALRDQEKQLLADKLRLERQWAAGADVQAVIAENQRVHVELDRLRDLLRQHGIEPDGGTARTA
jgi:Clp amino terminal domain, pathogenicity island component